MCDQAERMLQDSVVRDALRERDPYYAGELVVSRDMLFLVTPDGQVLEVGSTQSLLMPGK